MDCSPLTSYSRWNDPGAVPMTVPVARLAQQNSNFRTTLWTGNHLQLTVMTIPPRGEIGLEMHPETDQLLRVEAGQALVRMGTRRDRQEVQYRMTAGEAALIPCGIWHNVINLGAQPLKLSSLYAPPHHPRGTVHRTKAAAQAQP